MTLNITKIPHANGATYLKSKITFHFALESAVFEAQGIWIHVPYLEWFLEINIQVLSAKIREYMC